MNFSQLFNWFTGEGLTRLESARPWLIVGLGNPGSEYQNTRHNVGFWCIDLLSDRMRVKIRRTHRHVSMGESYLAGQPVVFVKPRTYVNRSGSAISYLLRRFAVNSERLLVILDDMNLDPGLIRIRREGSDGGHNGLKSIIQQIGTQRFARIRIGVGRPQGCGGYAKYVLSSLPTDERQLVKSAVARVADAAEVIVTDGVDKAMNRFN